MPRFGTLLVLGGVLLLTGSVLPGSPRQLPPARRPPSPRQRPQASPQNASAARMLQYRTLDDRLTMREYASLEEWQRRASYLREHILASAGLLPLPQKTPLRPQVFDERRHGGYSV